MRGHRTEKVKKAPINVSYGQLCVRSICSYNAYALLEHSSEEFTLRFLASYRPFPHVLLGCALAGCMQKEPETHGAGSQPSRPQEKAILEACGFWHLFVVHKSKAFEIR